MYFVMSKERTRYMPKKGEASLREKSKAKDDLTRTWQKGNRTSVKAFMREKRTTFLA